VPVDCYDDVLVIEEFERNKPGAYQLKYYAPGVGDIRVGWRGPEEEEKEGLELVKDVSLSPQALANARTDVLKMEKHAGKLIEKTYDWFAQDNKGTVWYFGEDTKEYENGKVVSTKGSWEAGVDGAKPGILMPAEPKVGHSYHQEYYPGEAMDMARVLSFDASVRVPYGSFDHVLETKEWTPLQPGFFEKKYYVRGVGPLGNPGDQALVDVKHS
jgi:hypothetical protein